MRSKLLTGLGLAAVLSVAAVALAGGFTKSAAPINAAQSQPASCVAQPSCTATECCPECIACCAVDGCCEECFLCCIEMGCDPSCCFPSATTKGQPQACKASVGCSPGSCSR
jgi:hypothetical protein